MKQTRGNIWKRDNTLYTRNNVWIGRIHMKECWVISILCFLTDRHFLFLWGLSSSFTFEHSLEFIGFSIFSSLFLLTNKYNWYFLMSSCPLTKQSPKDKGSIGVDESSLPIVITYKCDCNLILCIRVQFTTKSELAKFFSPSLVVWRGRRREKKFSRHFLKSVVDFFFSRQKKKLACAIFFTTAARDGFFYFFRRQKIWRRKKLHD